MQLVEFVAKYRHRRAIVVVAALLAALFAADMVVRMVTFGTWRSGFARWPEIVHRIEFAQKHYFPRYTKDLMLGVPEDYPAPIFRSDGDVEWTTFNALPPEAFISPPAAEAAGPGVVRIAFFGGSTTWNGYPQEVGNRLAERFGEGRVEVLNLGVSSSSSWTSLVVMRNYLPRWRPHLAVVYQGFNDQAHYLARSLALRSEADGVDFALDRARVHGLWGLVRSRSASPVQTRFHHMLEDGLYERVEDAWWSMARLAWAEGTVLVMSTFAAPSYATVPRDERAYFEAEFTHVYPWLGNVDSYATRLARENARIREFAALAGLPLIDLATAVGGGREIFKDNCHLNELGRYKQSEVVAAALAEPIQRLIDAGAPPPSPPVRGGADALPEQPSAECARGPCPAGACVIEAGRARLAYAPADQEPVIAAVIKALGVPRGWYLDARAATDWSHGAFCLDRTERSRADRAACVLANACPPYSETPDDDMPASLPTAAEARALCAFFGGRIPDEREWEAGARGDGRLLPWGDRWSGAEANLCGRECPYGQPSDPDDGAVGPAPRGQFAGTSPSGLRDTAGNLAEWVESCTDGSCTEWLRGGSALSPPGLLWRQKPEGIADTAPRLRGVRCAYDIAAKPPGTDTVAQTEPAPVRQ